MKASKQTFATRCLVSSVRCAMGAMMIASPAYAADAEPDPALDLSLPVSKVEIGAGNVIDKSSKFGEYNGLEKKGAYAIGNIDLRGGSETDATRWRITGTNVGLEARNLTGEYGEQGRFRINFGYDELLRNRSDTYQTPYVGAGSSTFTLPSTWIVPPVTQVSATAGFSALSPVAGTAPRW
jgi:hypothetical protein